MGVIPLDVVWDPPCCGATRHWRQPALRVPAGRHPQLTLPPCRPAPQAQAAQAAVRDQAVTLKQVEGERAALEERLAAAQRQLTAAGREAAELRAALDAAQQQVAALQAESSLQGNALRGALVAAHAGGGDPEAAALEAEAAGLLAATEQRNSDLQQQAMQIKGQVGTWAWLWPSDALHCSTWLSTLLLRLLPPVFMRRR